MCEIKYQIMMPCISKSVNSKAFSSFNYYLVFIFLLNNLEFATCTLSTTVPSLLSPNYTSNHEPVCSNVKDIFAQRGIAEKDLPAKLPIKGEKRADKKFLKTFSSASEISSLRTAF